MLDDETACVDTCFNLHCERNLIHIHPSRVGSLASFKNNCDVYEPEVGFQTSIPQLLDWIKPLLDYAVINNTRVLKFYHIVMIHIIFTVICTKAVLTSAQEETAEKLLLFFDLSTDNLPWVQKITCYVRKESV